MISTMARAATTADVFNAVGDTSRRQILDSLSRGEATVGQIVTRLDLPQPKVSKHLKVLREVDLVRCRHDGRRRLYRVHGPALAPMHDWLTRLTAAVNAHYDRLDDYLADLQRTTPEAAKEPQKANEQEQQG
jgi:DNA-binding transcriptional ArsR family regulator